MSKTSFKIRRKFHKKIRQHKRKYMYVCKLDMGDDQYLMVCSEQKPDETEKYSELARISFFSATPCYVGWNVDRHRFYVESFVRKTKNNRPSRNSRFLRERWEHNYGYACQKLRDRTPHIQAFLTKEKIKEI